MIPYIILFILAVLCAATDVIATRNRIVLFIPFFLLMFGLVAFRDHLGGSDYYMYEAFYSRVVPIGDYFKGLYEPYFRTKSFETGYVILSSIIRSFDFTNGPYFYMFVIAVINFCIFFPSLREYTPYVMIAILFFLYKAYFWHEFTLLRQSLAISLFTYSIRFVHRKEYWKYIAINLLGVSFHATAIILLPLCFILNKKFNDRTILIFMGVAFVLSFLAPYMWQLCHKVATMIGIGERLSFYVMDKRSINPLNIIEILVVLFVALFYRKIYESKEPYFNIFLNIFLFSSLFVISFSSFEVFARFKEYFVVAYMILISYFVGHVSNNRSRWAIFLGLTLYVALGYFRYIFIFDDGGLIPYKWILW